MSGIVAIASKKSRNCHFYIVATKRVAQIGVVRK